MACKLSHLLLCCLDKMVIYLSYGNINIASSEISLQYMPVVPNSEFRSCEVKPQVIIFITLTLIFASSEISLQHIPFVPNSECRSCSDKLPKSLLIMLVENWVLLALATNV